MARQRRDYVYVLTKFTSPDPKTQQTFHVYIRYRADSTREQMENVAEGYLSTYLSDQRQQLLGRDTGFGLAFARPLDYTISFEAITGIPVQR